MGVIGLTTFVDDHSQLLKDHRFHDSRVLIDGNNLYYFLYYRYFNINIRYGGDYDCYADSIRYYFNTLRSCNIIPYVIFDGGYDMEERKLKTTIKRQHTRLKNVTSLARGQNGQVFPLLGNEVFRQVLNEMKISHMTCDFEADDQLAALAKRWCCPVMSNDSDFFIFDLPGGFIIFDYIDLQIQKCKAGEDPDFPDGYSYLNVQLYKVDHLEKLYKGLHRRFLPIFATLIGNDFVEGAEFENFFARAKLPKVGNARNRVQQKQQKMAGVLMWLSDQDDLDHTITYIVNSFPDGKRKKARALLDISVKSYTDIADHLVGYFEDEECRYKNRTKLQTCAGNPVPYWIVSGLRKGEIPNFIINTLTLHRNILLPQVELVTEPCSFTCSRPIRIAMYSILMSLDAKLGNQIAGKKEKSGKELIIQEYHRSINDLTCERIELSKVSQEDSSVPYLQKIPHLPQSERDAIFWETVQVKASAFKDLPRGLHLVLASMCFWVAHATPKITANYVYALVACIIRLMFVSDVPKDDTTQNVSTSDENLEEEESEKGSSKKEFEKENSYPDDDDKEDILEDEIKDDQDHHKVDVYPEAEETLSDFVREVLQNCTPEERDSAKKNSDRFTVETKHTSTENRFNTLITHNFSQFQTCLLSLMHLNMLLMQPLPNCYPALVFNGTFLYNLVGELQRRTQPKTYICEQFGLKSSLSKLYLKMVDSVLEVVPEESFLSDGAKKKTKKKTKSKKKSPEAKEDSDSVQEETDDCNPTDSMSVNCSLANRFMGLSLENE